jgi:hypothetical protein
MKNKLLNIRVSEEFETLLNILIKTDKFLELGISSKSELIRYSLLVTISKSIGFDNLKKLKNIKEVESYFEDKEKTTVYDLKQFIKKINKENIND